ncbi:MAG: type II secretion system F family protein [Clostridiales Family XIII bacterium]|jgi:hypothetical protein|nr:type II secretion system F family protein [Clostridiales Family XIII bacterium]
MKGDKVKKTADARRKSSFDFVGVILRLLPERLTGTPAEFARRYSGARACGDAISLAEAMRRKTATYYALLAIAAVVAGSAAVQQLSSGGDIEPVEREGLGGTPKYIEAEVNAEYDGENLRKQVSVTVLPKEPSASDAAAALEDVKSRLPDAILGQNESLESVVYDLELVTADEETGALISWSSDRPDAIDEEGRVNLIDGKPGDEVVLSAEIVVGEAMSDLDIVAVTGASETGRGYVRDLEDSVDRLVAALSGSADGATVALPESTESGVRTDWRTPRETGALAALFLLPPIAFFVYRNRYRTMDKAVAEMRSSIKRDFPDFLSKLLLLLNAGLVVTAAVEKIAEDYRERRRPGEEKVFFEELLGMEDRIRGANTSLISEFSGLAARSGQREVLRFSAILADNIDKGSALADKLMQEEGMLRVMRKKRAEEKGRLAETKLTFPMALQLGAIIIITVAPAMFDMG